MIIALNILCAILIIVAIVYEVKKAKKRKTATTAPKVLETVYSGKQGDGKNIRNGKTV